MSDGKIEIDSEIKTNKVVAGINKLKEKFKSLAKTSGGDIAAISVAFTALAVVTKKVTETISALNQAYLKQAKAEKTLEIAARNNPYLNSERVKDLKKFASELQNISEIGDEQLLPMMGELAAAGRSQAEIQEIMRAAVDASASGLISLESAVQSLNQSYNGEVGALGKILPKLKNLTKEQLKNGEAVKMVKEAYSGMAYETADIGKQLSNNWGDFTEKLGKGVHAIAKPFQYAANAIVTGLNVIGDQISGKWAWDLLEAFQSPSEKFRKQIEKDFGEVVSGTAGTISFEAENLKKLAEVRDKYQKQYLDEKKKYEEEMKDWNANAAKRQEERIKQEQKYLVKMAELQKKYPSVNLEFTGGELRIGQSLTATGSRKSKKEVEDYNNAKGEINKFNKNNAKVSQVWDLPKNYSTVYKGDYDAAEKQYQKEAERIRKLEKEALQHTQKQYDQYLETAKTDLAYKEKTGIKMSELEKAQSMLNAAESVYNEFIKNDIKPTQEITEDIQKRRKEVERLVKEQTAADAKKGYDDSIKAAKEEMEFRVQTGEKLSEAEKLQEELNTKVRAYIVMRQQAGSAISDENDKVKKILKDIEELTKKAEKQGLLEKWLNGDSTEAEIIKKQIETLNSEYQQLIELTELTEEQKYKIREKWAKQTEELNKKLNDQEANDWKKSLEGAQQFINFANEALSNLYSSMTEMSEMVQQQAENEATVKMAALEKQYANAEISEEEYYDKKEKIEKESAQKAYKMQLWAWSAQLLQIGASTAQGIMNALATSGNIYAGIAMAATVGALGAAQTAAAIANKPIPPSFATGGYIGGMNGASMGDDNTYIHARNGELVLNARQQREVWNMVNGRGNNNNGNNVVIKNYRGNDTNISTSFNQDGLQIAVRKMVSDDLKNGKLNDSLMAANNRMDGIFIQ